MNKSLADGCNSEAPCDAATNSIHLLQLAAAPAFAIMALLTLVRDGSADVLCAIAGASPLGGMVPMYLLISAFHSAPWLKLVLGRRGGVDGS